jgi:outer membrane protein TolC
MTMNPRGKILFLTIFWFLVLGAALSGEEKPTEITFSSADEAMRFGLQNAKDIGYQRLGALEQMKLKRLSFRDFLPYLSVSYSENDTVAVQAPDSRSRSLEFSVTQQVYDAGKSRLEYELNNLNALYGYQEYLVAARKKESEILTGYMKLVTQKKALSIQEELFASAQRQLAILAKEYELGVALETDYLEYAISCSQIEYQKQTYYRDFGKLEREFKKLVGIDETTALRIADYEAGDRLFRAIGKNADALWNRVKANSVDLAKKGTSLQYTKRQAVFDGRQNIPTVSLQSSLSFSGSGFPLTEPALSVRCIFNFNNKLFPSSLSTGYGFTKGRLNNVSDSVDVSVLNSSTYFAENRITKLSLLTAELDYETAESDLKTSVYDAIWSHDDTVKNIELKANTVGLMEKKLKISEKKTERGEMKRIDLLDEMTSLSKAKIELLSLEAETEGAERSLAILLGVPFGEDLDAIAK